MSTSSLAVREEEWLVDGRRGRLEVRSSGKMSSARSHRFCTGGVRNDQRERRRRRGWGMMACSLGWSAHLESDHVVDVEAVEMVCMVLTDC
jgi:hypothetical protein